MPLLAANSMAVVMIATMVNSMNVLPMVLVAFSLSPAPIPRYPHRRAHRKADDDDGEHMHYLRAVGHRRRAGDIAVLPYDEQIRQSVEDLQEI